MCLECDHPNCTVHKDVEDGLKIMRQFSGAIAAVKEDYKDTKQVQSEIHDALLEQTMSLKHVNENIERDRGERKELYRKAEDARVALEGKANKDDVNKELKAIRKEKIGNTGIGIVTGIVIIIFVALTFVGGMINGY